MERFRPTFCQRRRHWAQSKISRANSSCKCSGFYPVVQSMSLCLDNSRKEVDLLTGKMPSNHTFSIRCLSFYGIEAVWPLLIKRAGQPICIRIYTTMKINPSIDLIFPWMWYQLTQPTKPTQSTSQLKGIKICTCCAVRFGLVSFWKPDLVKKVTYKDSNLINSLDYWIRCERLPE